MIKIEKMSTGSATRKPALVAVSTGASVTPLVLRAPEHVHIEGRCNCFDVIEVDEFDPPKSYPDRLAAFVADLVAHGAHVEVVRTPAVAKARRRMMLGS